MRTTNSTTGLGRAPAPELSAPDIANTMVDLELLPPGRRLYARDGNRFIRTNLIGSAFCDLATGQLCSARDICTKHGGITARLALRIASMHERDNCTGCGTCAP